MSRTQTLVEPSIVEHINQHGFISTNGYKLVTEEINALLGIYSAYQVSDTGEISLATVRPKIMSHDNEYYAYAGIFGIAINGQDIELHQDLLSKYKKTIENTQLLKNKTLNLQFILGDRKRGHFSLLTIKIKNKKIEIINEDTKFLDDDKKKSLSFDKKLTAIKNEVDRVFPASEGYTVSCPTYQAAKNQQGEDDGYSCGYRVVREIILKNSTDENTKKRYQDAKNNSDVLLQITKDLMLLDLNGINPKLSEEEIKKYIASFKIADADDVDKYKTNSQKPVLGSIICTKRLDALVLNESHGVSPELHSDDSDLMSCASEHDDAQKFDDAQSSTEEEAIVSQPQPQVAAPIPKPIPTPAVAHTVEQSLFTDKPAEDIKNITKTFQDILSNDENKKGLFNALESFSKFDLEIKKNKKDDSADIAVDITDSAKKSCIVKMEATVNKLSKGADEKVDITLTRTEKTGTVAGDPITVEWTCKSESKSGSMTEKHLYILMAQQSLALRTSQGASPANHIMILDVGGDKTTALNKKINGKEATLTAKEEMIIQAYLTAGYERVVYQCGSETYDFDKKSVSMVDIKTQEAPVRTSKNSVAGNSSGFFSRMFSKLCGYQPKKTESGNELTK